jgi:hypothetical protein
LGALRTSTQCRSITPMRVKLCAYRRQIAICHNADRLGSLLGGDLDWAATYDGHYMAPCAAYQSFLNVPGVTLVLWHTQRNGKGDNCKTTSAVVAALFLAHQPVIRAQPVDHQRPLDSSTPLFSQTLIVLHDQQSITGLYLRFHACRTSQNWRRRLGSAYRYPSILDGAYGNGPISPRPSCTIGQRNSPP